MPKEITFPLLDKKTNSFLSEFNGFFINFVLLIKIGLPRERLLSVKSIMTKDQNSKYDVTVYENEKVFKIVEKVLTILITPLLSSSSWHKIYFLFLFRSVRNP